jgi:Protein of unknown function (DUF3500)
MNKTVHAVKTALLLLCLGLLIGRAAVQGQRRATADTTAAANQFLASLSAEQRAKATIKVDDPNRVDWHYIPRPGARKGLPLKEMTPGQRQAAQNLLSTALSAKGVKRSNQIMNDLELVLRGEGPKPNMGRDPELYYFTVFGMPGDKAWGWRVEGHHLSQNFTVVNGTLTSWTPDFYGANPAEVMEGSRKGLRVLAAEEDKAFALLHALDAEQKQSAVLQQTVPNDMITTNSRRVNPLSPDGLTASRMTPAQQRLLRDLVNEYTSRMVDDIAAERMRRIDAGGFDKVSFAWIGADALHEAHYYRVQGPTFLIEFDNVQSGGNHIHSVWRDFNGDFGDDVLKNHYQVAHVQGVRGKG